MQLSSLLDQIEQGASTSWPTTLPSPPPPVTPPADLSPQHGTAAPGDRPTRRARAGARTPCQAHPDVDLWFAERTADVERAKDLCRTCPVREACLAGALHRAEPWGVWGGEVLVDGAVVARKRGRGRPRKDEAAA